MANGGRIDYTVGFKTDKSGLNQLKSSLQEIKALTAQDLMKIGGHNDIKRAETELDSLKKSIKEIDGALERAFNADLGTLNVSKFNQELKKLPLKDIYKDFSNAGAAGQAAFRNTTAQVLTTNMQLKQTHKVLDDIATTMSNTIKWGLASSVMNNFTGSVQQAYGYVKNLDSSLNDIRIVTGKSSEEMSNFAKQANNAAKALGKSTTNYTDAALIYYQQGLSDEDVAARAETTLKAASVTGQSGEAVSEQLTAVWNGYKVSAQEAELYIDKLAAVAATTASDLEELSTGMSKVASAANLMGVDIDQLNAQMATIISVTRQAPESVGTALKTIYARMGDIEAGLDGEVSLDEYTEQMASMGVNVLDASGKLRDMGSVIEEIGGKWSSMSREQQLSLSQTMAGTRQYNNLLSLFDNWDMYTNALNTSADAAGTLQEQQDIYMESTEAHLNQLKAASEDLYDSLLNADSLNPLIDGMTTVVNLFGTFIDAIGGGGNALMGLGSIGLRVFSKQLGTGIATTIQNLAIAKDNAMQLRAEMEVTELVGSLDDYDKRQNLVQMKKDFLQYSKSATEEERNLSNELIKQTNELYKQQDELEERKNFTKENYKKYTGQDLDDIDELNKEEKNQRINDLEKTKEDLTDVKKGLNEGLEYLENQKAIKKVQKEIVELETQSKKTGEKLTEEAQKRLKFLKEEETKLIKKNVKKTSPIEQIARFEELLDDGFFEGESAKKLQEGIDNFLKNAKEGTVGYEAEVRKLTNLFENELNNAIKEVDDTIEGLGTDFKQEAEEIENNIKEVQGSFEALKNSLDLKSAAQGIVDAIGAIGEIGTALNNLANLDDIWNDESLSAGERAIQIAENLGTSTVLLITGITALKGSLKDLSGLVIASAKSFLTSTAAQNSQAIASLGLTAKNLTLGQSFKVLGIAIKEALLPLLPFIAAGAAVAVIAGLLVKAFDEAHTSAKEASENFKKSSEEFKEVEENLSSLEDKLKTTTDRIKELEEAAAKGQISLVEKEELKNLIKENTLLETQIKLEKEKLKIKQQQLASDYKTSLDKGVYDTDYNKTVFTKGPAGGYGKDTGLHSSALKNLQMGRNSYVSNKGGLFNTGFGSKATEFKLDKNIPNIFDLEIDAENAQEQFDSWVLAMTNAQTEASNLANESTGEESEEYSDIANKIGEDIKEAQRLWAEGRSEMVSQLTEGYTDGLEALPALIATNTAGQNDEAIKKIYEIGKDYHETLGTLNEVTVDAFDDIVPDKDTFEKLLDEELFDEAGSVDEQMLQEILGDKGFENLKISSEALGLSMSDLVAQLQSGEITFSDLQTSATNTALAIDDIADSLTQLQTATESKSGIESLFEKYENGMYLDQNEVAEILTENPEYIEYLEKVGDKYVLNKEATEDWTEATKAQKEAIEEMMGSYEPMGNYNDSLDNIKHDSSHGRDAEGNILSGVGNQSATTEEDLDNLIAKNQELNTSLAEGKIKASEYFDGLSDAVSESGLHDALSQLNGEFDESTDYIEEMTATLATEVSDALVQTNKQFLRGEIGVSDYVEALGEGAKTEQELLESLHDLDEAQKTVNENGAEQIEITDDMTDEVKEAAEAWNEMADAQKDLEEAQGFADMITENAEFLDSYTDSAGNLMDTIMDDTRFTSYVESLSSQLASFASESTANMNTTAAALAEAAGVGVEQAKTALENGTGAVQAMLGNSLSATQSMTNFSMGQVSTAITNTSSALGSVLSALGEAISSFDYTIIGTPTIVPGKFDPVTFVKSKGKEGIKFPKLGLKIHGEGGSSAKALGQALSDAGTYFTNQGAAEAAAEAMDLDSYLPDNKRNEEQQADKLPDTGKKDDSKSNKKDPEKMDYLEEEKDIYHDINIELEQLENSLKKLEQQEEHLFGKELSDNLNEQLKILKKQADAYREKIKLAKQESNQLKTQLKQQGVKFDSEGTITNYNAIIQKEMNQVNAIIEKYNAMSAEAQEKYKDTVEKAKEDFELFKEQLERYEEIINSEIPDYEESILDAGYEAIEVQIQKFDLEMNIRLEITEAIKDLEDFQKKFNEIMDATWGIDAFTENVVNDLTDKTERALVAMGKTVEEGFEGWSLLDEAKLEASSMKDMMDSETVSTVTDQLNTARAELEKIRNGGTSDIYTGRDKDGNLILDDEGKPITSEQQARDHINELMSTLSGELTAVLEKKEAIDELYLESIEKVVDEFDKQMEQYEVIGDTLEHSLNMVDLLMGDSGSKEKIAIYDQMLASNQNKLEDQIAKRDYYKSMYESETDEEAREKWLELWQDSMADVNATVEEQTELLMSKLQETTKDALNEMNKGLTGGKGLDYINKEWEMNTMNKDAYLDGVNSLYAIQSLENKIQDSINNTDSLSAQRRLNKLKEEELNKLREKDKLTQYDVDRANQLYEIELKKIALEEAQRNKAQMRLRRDSSGNYSYQFVADQDSIIKAQQELDAAQNSLYNLDKDQYRKSQEEYLSIYQEFQDYVNEYHSLSIEEQKLREDEYNMVVAAYMERLGNINQDYQEARLNLEGSTVDSLIALYENNGIAFNDMIDSEQKKIKDEFFPAYSQSMEAMMELTGKEGEDGKTGLAAAWDTADASIKKAFKDITEGVTNAEGKLSPSIAALEKALGTGEGGLTKVTSDYYQVAKTGAEQVIADQTTMIAKAQEEVTKIGEIKTAVDSVVTAWGDAKEAIEAYARANKTLVESAKEEAQDVQEQTEDDIEEPKKSEEPKKPSKPSEPDLSVNDTVTVKKSATHWTRDGGNGTKMSSWVPGSSFQVAKTDGNEVLLKRNNTAIGWIERSDLEGFNTGGYTGEWGKEGKMAVLHEKELVLNAKDTENMLHMIELVREAMDMKVDRRSNAKDENYNAMLYEVQSHSTSLLEHLLSNSELFLELNEIIKNDILSYSDYSLSSVLDMMNTIERGIETRLSNEDILTSFNDIKKDFMENFNVVDSLNQQIDTLKQNLAVKQELMSSKDAIKEYEEAMSLIQKELSGNNFEIHADFPNATSGEEVVAALLDLPNVASQYAYSTMRKV